MVQKSDKEKVRMLLSETIRMICKNGLNFKVEFSVEALIGITLDRDDEFFISIKETVKSDIPFLREKKERVAKRLHDIKGEPPELSAPTPRKRSIENTTNKDDPNLPNLSLSDMGQSDQSFWGTVPEEDERADSGEETSKKDKSDHEDDEENTNVVEVKGEPGSESEDDHDDTTCVESGDHDQSMDQSMGDMSNPFMYATPVSSEQSMMADVGKGPIPWEQIGPFPIPVPEGDGMPGSGGNLTQERQAAAPVNNPATMDSTVNLDNTRQEKLSIQQALPNRKITTAKLQRLLNLQKDPYYIPRLMRRIMLTKGREVTPKQVYWNFSYRDRPSVALIHQVMKELASKGMGQYGKNDRKTFFTKCEPWTIGSMLSSYGVDIQKYEKQFFALDENQPGPSGFNVI